MIGDMNVAVKDIVLVPMTTMMMTEIKRGLGLGVPLKCPLLP